MCAPPECVAAKGLRLRSALRVCRCGPTAQSGKSTILEKKGPIIARGTSGRGEAVLSVESPIMAQKRGFSGLERRSPAVERPVAAWEWAIRSLEWMIHSTEWAVRSSESTAHSKE
jgi:hypothetical protein